MKAVQKIKKMVALGMGLTMVGATIIGASAKLSSYPEPFVMKGVPSSNLAVVVGDDAKGSDTLAAVDIIAALQASAVTKVAGVGGETKLMFSGNVVEIGSPTDLLELNEPLGDVKPKLTSLDLPDFLKSTTITTQQGVTLADQYLTFNVSNGANVTAVEDEFGNYGTYLQILNGFPVFEWTLQFQEGLRSATDDVNSTLSTIRELEDRDLNILGQTFTVAQAKIETLSTTASTARDVQLTLLGGPVYDSLGEGAKKTYTVSSGAGASKEYEVEVLLISETDQEVLLKVNGQTLPKLRKGETVNLADGTLLGIKDVLATGKDTQSSLARFYVGATKIFLKDTGLGDDAFYTAGAEVNNEVIEDASVKIKGSLTTNRDEVVIESITYLLTADALKTVDLYVPQGKGVRESLDEPEGMLSPTWDIRYEGLKDVGETTIKITPVGVDRAEFSGVNQAGKAYTYPLFDVSGTNRHWGITTNGVQRDLRFRETTDTNGYQQNCTVRVNDYFMVSNYDVNTLASTTDGAEPNPQIPEGSSPPSNAFSAVLKYESIDATNNVLTFTDIAGGTKQVTYTQGTSNGILGVSTNTTTLIVDGNSYPVEVCNDNRLAISLNGDTVLDGNQAVWVGEGDLIVTLPPGQNTENASNMGAQNSLLTKMLITTQSRLFDERTTNDVLVINITDDETNGRYNIPNAQIRSNGTGTAAPSSLNEDPRNYQLYTLFGSFLELFVPTGNTIPPVLTYKHGQSQRGAQVVVTAGDFQKQEVTTGTTEKVNQLSVGISKLASEVADNLDSFDAIVVGGPCANTAAFELLGKPADCTEGFAAGKAVVRLFQHSNGRAALLVAGFAADDTRRAGKAVASGQLASVSSDQAEVSGTKLTDFTVKALG